ncbi:MAG: DUF504 domain-containing protein [Candidatus Aenigmarchaeota archaeon]|nr:DUF504 domain-containing protein [Candidatus Aenigmarchaeota archaeon]
MKSELVEKINKLIWTGEMPRYRFLILHRGAPGNEKWIDGEAIEALKNRFLILKDGTMIPIHRIKKISKKV